VTAHASAPGQAPIIVPVTADYSNAAKMVAWIDEAKDIISESFDSMVCILID
jgi:hypothetical protein